MSSLLPRITPELTRRLPWDELFVLFQLKNGITELETVLRFQRGTLSKAQREYPANWLGETPRGLSANAHQVLLEAMAVKFSSGGQMRTWMQKHWPMELLQQSTSALETLYQSIDLEHQIPQVGTFPIDYVERDEKARIITLLLEDKQAQVVWVTGPGGSGKSTLALSLLRLDREPLSGQFGKIFWVNLEVGGYADGLRQIGDVLNLMDTSTDGVEQKIRALTRHSRVLFLLDALHDVAELGHWRQLAGSLGRLVVTSRERLSGVQQSDASLRQVELRNFSQAAAFQFLHPDNLITPANRLAVEKIIDFTEGLPQALRLLKSYQREASLSFSELWQRLEQYRFSLLSRPGMTGKGESLKICFDFSLDLLQSRYPQAATLFEQLGIFQDNAVVWDVLYLLFGLENMLDFEHVVLTLARFNLVSLLPYRAHRIVQTHRLLYEYARYRLADQRTQIDQAYRLVMRVILETFTPGPMSSPYYPVRMWLIKDLEYLVVWTAEQGSLAEINWMLDFAFKLLLAEGKVVTAEKLLVASWNRIPAAQRTAFHASEYYKYQAAIQTAQGNLEQALHLAQKSARLAQKDLKTLNTKETGDILGDFLARRNQIYKELFERQKIGQDVLQGYARILRFFRARKVRMKFDLFQFLPAGTSRHQNDPGRIAQLNEPLFRDARHPVHVRAQAGINLVDALLGQRNMLQAERVLLELEHMLVDHENDLAYALILAHFWIEKAIFSDLLGDRLSSIQACRVATDYWRDVVRQGRSIPKDVQEFLDYVTEW